MSELKKQDIRSPEMQDVMSGIPGSFLKWGLFVFFAIVLILVAGSYFIKSPDIVTVPIVITTLNPPVTLVVKTGGEIKNLFVTENSRTSIDSVVALIANTCNYDDFKKLNFFLSGFDEKTDWIKIVRTKKLPENLSLGEIQSAYSQFEKAWSQMGDYLDQAYIPTKLILLEKQIEKKIEYNAEMSKQKELLTEDLGLERKSFERDSTFFKMNNRSISLAEFEKSKQGYLQKQYSYSSFNASLKNNESDFLKLNETRLDLQNQYENELHQYSLSMQESLQLMKSSISQWEEKYLLKSPISGRVTLTRFRNENQVIKTGEILATVIPDSLTTIVARAVIPASGFGRIEIGQQVNIKLSGFPYMQYGILKGRIVSLSQVPGEGGFSADIELTSGMTTSYREKIKFIHQMDGIAEIITRDTRLINKFLNPLRNAIKN
jgi:HlyD family secretion protein